MKRLLHNCDMPKHQILHSVLFNAFSGPSKKTKKLILSQALEPDQLKLELERIKKETQSIPLQWRRGSVINVADVSNAIPTFMPGNILYIEKLRDFTNQYRNPVLSPTSMEEAAYALAKHHHLGDASLVKLKKQISKGIETVKRVVKKDLKYVYVPRWAERHEFQQIIVSRSMISDHLPFSIFKQFEEAPPGFPLRTTT